MLKKPSLAHFAPNLSLADFKKAFQESDCFAQLVGYYPDHVEKGKCVYIFESNENHMNPYGILHGGALYAAMDSSQGLAVHTYLDLEKFWGITAEASIRYKQPFTKGKITIKTEIKEHKKTILYVISNAYDENNNLLAALEQKWMVLKRISPECL